MLNLATQLISDRPKRRNIISAKVYDELREAIITARIKPGSNLAETEVAIGMGISRTPVREAFARLFDEGLIEISPQTGTRVSRIDMARVNEAKFIRATLESAVIEKSSIDPDAAVLDEIELGLRAQTRLIDSGDMGALHRSDMAFHAALMNAFGFPHAWSACQHISADMMRIQFLLGMRTDHVRNIVAEHRAIFDAVRESSRSQAAKLVMAHMSNVDFDIAVLERDHRDFFMQGTL